MRRTNRALLAVIAGTWSLAPSPSPAMDDIASMNDWASEVVELVRGPMNIAFPGDGDANFGVMANVIGAASGMELDVVSLGDGGHIVLGFASGISDGPGDDFAVFENGFWNLPFGLFAEFAFVEVSSNGVDFIRFDAVTTRSIPVWSFEEVDPLQYDYFAGDVERGYGTLFDLAELAGHPLVLNGMVDLDWIECVRVIDVVGNGSQLDALGNPVYDPYPTPFPEGGFDLDGVGVIHLPEPGVAVSLATGSIGLAMLLRRRSRLADPNDDHCGPRS
jgi:hypothetical protein